ncbi:hypothetical protein BATDEDRAFT_91320 [Batrachochytrium dendrobatidis JAM81]|uniref:Uncharacterized protein n=1 Tax=Batrachochytrium dendrobatidis (strain JAM81 / FGSC 10211) TaxID=684364 RepID=F4PA02_BATDJ|nr:uncharacterized protein BATDEDRAFT_91320 [Batrachochytrium dendrobatidis JAM81]EGF77919.1 hypothetical protein BATDEDRAFT_91320 [Batrachochytrium dendrobatidis JAM81]|eukprot:XP_006681506.1 hypothetical protein BATDEDRAFT_91320 [Batrachochytrium dendrobatidis JAM81]
MKLVDILLVLSAAATANAILIPTGNDGLPQASGTFSQVSDPTNEPNPGTSDDWQSIVDAVNLSILDEDWKYLFDPIDPNTSDQDWQQLIDQPSSSTFSQVSGTADKPDSNIYNQDQQQPMDQPSPSTPKRGRKRPIDEPGSNISKYDQKQSMNQPSPSASKQSRKQSVDEPGLDIPDKDWQHLIDEVNSNTFEDWRELFDIAGLNTPSQVSDSIDQVGPSNFDKYQQQPADKTSSSIPDQTQQHPIDATDLNISDQDPQQPIDQSSPSTSKRSRKRRIDQPSPSTSRQDQQQPMEQDQQQPMIHDESGNTVPNQATVLNERDQRTFDRMKKRLVASKIVQKKKHKKYCDYEAIGLEQQLALERGEEISGSTYDPKVEKQLKEEYVAASRKVPSIRQRLKRFMKRRGLEFQEPDSDLD